MPGKRVNEAEYERRVGVVFDLLIGGASRSQILQYVANESDWKVSPRMVDEYIARANKRLEEIARPMRAKALGLALARREDLYLKCRRVQDYKSCLAVDHDRAKLLGLYAAEEHRLTGKDGENLAFPIAAAREIIAAYGKK